MMISQLPQIEIPSEETLNDEDNNIIKAFDIIFNGYKRSQSRLHTISKAYIKLESIAQSLLNENHKNDKTSPKKEETLDREKHTRKELSPLQLHTNESHDDILTVDLTYDFETLEQSTDSAARASSPIFGHQIKKIKKNNSSDEANLSKESIKKNNKTEAAGSTKKWANQEEKILINKVAEGNEENRPPIISKPSFKSPKNLAINSTQFSNESQTVSKIGFSKTVYNIDTHKTPTGKRSRQATLIFQPQTSKTNVSYSEKNSAKPDDFCKRSDLFDVNYCNTKKLMKNNCQENEESPEIFAADSVTEKSVNFLSTKSAVTSPEILKSNKISNLAKNLGSEKADNFIIATTSQIDETARSLFDDEDLEEFEASKDLLNTCLDSPNIVENVTLKDLGNKHKNIVPNVSNSNSQSSQFSCAMESIDETFFAPVEIDIPKKEVKKMEKINLKSDFSTSVETKHSTDKNRNLKRKPEDKTQIEVANQLGDLEVQDIDWDQDITTDNWPALKKPLNDSFDFVPQKKKKSPNFAYKGKVERNHAERAKLPGWDCKDCEKYYGTLNLSEEELKKHMNRCSRHRSKYNPRNFTPKNFWNPVFPDATDSSDFSDDESFEKPKKTDLMKTKKS